MHKAWLASAFLVRYFNNDKLTSNDIMQIRNSFGSFCELVRRVIIESVWLQVVSALFANQKLITNRINACKMWKTKRERYDCAVALATYNKSTHSSINADYNAREIGVKHLFGINSRKCD